VPLSGLLSGEHLGALAGIAAAIVVLVVAARIRPGIWIGVLALVLVADEVSWWIYMGAGGGEPGQRAQPLPLQLCDVAIFAAAAALLTRRALLVEITYFWGLAGTIQALFTPDLPQHFPSYPFFQYYLAHGGVVAAALILVVGLRIRPREWAFARVAGVTVAYAAFVGIVDALTGADYMYLRSKPVASTPLDWMGPWPWYILSAAVVGVFLFALLDAPFRPGRLREGRAEALR
jgi:hypothetical integral membrane protein (TIGR02206 family)